MVWAGGATFSRTWMASSASSGRGLGKLLEESAEFTGDPGARAGGEAEEMVS